MLSVLRERRPWRYSRRSGVRRYDLDLRAATRASIQQAVRSMMIRPMASLAVWRPCCSWAGAKIITKARTTRKNADTKAPSIAI